MVSWKSNGITNLWLVVTSPPIVERWVPIRTCFLEIGVKGPKGAVSVDFVDAVHETVSPASPTSRGSNSSS